MKFIGIDLAWTYKNETGLCILDESGKVLYLDAQVFSDEDIIGIIRTYATDDLCIAVDAPLVLENEKGAREADRLLTRARVNGHQLKLFMANRGFFESSYGLVRGEVLAEKVQKCFKDEFRKKVEFDFFAEKGRSILVETFPTGICCGLFPDIYPVKYKVKGKVPYTETNAEFHRILKRICDVETIEGRVAGVMEHFDYEGKEITRKAHKHIEDKMDAFLSAYGLFAIYRGYAQPLSFGAIHDGFITIPVVN